MFAAPRQRGNTGPAIQRRVKEGGGEAMSAALHQRGRRRPTVPEPSRRSGR